MKEGLCTQISREIYPKYVTVAKADFTFDGTCTVCSCNKMVKKI